MKNPYRETTRSPAPKKLGVEALGSVSINGEWRPIFERQYKGKQACEKCKGFGTYGNPFCGAVYKCGECNGSGKRK